MYRVDVPRKPVLLTNRAMALHRLENTEKRLKRSSDIAQTHSKCIEQYVKKGFATIVPGHERTKWYLTHFPVLRPEKDTAKVRICF